MNNKAIFVLLLVGLCFGGVAGVTAVAKRPQEVQEVQMVIPPDKQAEVASFVLKMTEQLKDETIDPQEEAWVQALNIYGVPIDSVRYREVQQTGVSSAVER